MERAKTVRIEDFTHDYGKSFFCSICDMAFETEMDRFRHINWIHLSPDLIACEFCHDLNLVPIDERTKHLIEHKKFEIFDEVKEIDECPQNEMCCSNCDRCEEPVKLNNLPGVAEHPISNGQNNQLNNQNHKQFNNQNQTNSNFNGQNQKQSKTQNYHQSNERNHGHQNGAMEPLHNDDQSHCSVHSDDTFDSDSSLDSGPTLDSDPTLDLDRTLDSDYFLEDMPVDTNE